MEKFFRKCSTCKGDIDWGESYYACSISTCNRKGTDFAFCSVECWEAHVPLLRHRDAWAEERRAPAGPPVSPPSRASVDPSVDADAQAEVGGPEPGPAPAEGSQARGEDAATDLLPPLALADRSATPEEVLVVASRLKAYIRARSGMNTSDGVLGPLSVILRDLCDEAIERAHADGRKTVLERDILAP